MKVKVNILMVMVLLLGILPTGVKAETTFKDVPSNAWYLEDLSYIMKDSRQILKGYPNGNFGPKDTLTVGQFVKCIIEAADLEVDMTDTEGYWAKPYIDRAKGMLYILDGEFEVEKVDVSTNDKDAGKEADPYAVYKRPITRGEMSRIVVRAVKDITGLYDYRKEEEIKKLIKDYNNIHYSVKNHVVKIYDMGIITGYPDGSFGANNPLTREEAVAIIRRTIDEGARKSPAIGGVEIVEGIEFDRERDIVPKYESMALDKQQEFVMKFYNSLKFYTVDGKSYVEGYVPNLPEGFEWTVSLMIFYKNDAKDTYFTGDDTREEVRIDVGEPFKIHLKGDKKQCDHMLIDVWIENAETGSEDGRFFLEYPEKTLEKYDETNLYNIPYNWEEVIGLW